jgi:hypothetical protein
LARDWRRGQLRIPRRNGPLLNIDADLRSHT